jgi:hypothetical protein
MIADAKSRFAKIIDEIVLDTDEFIKAITDAINSAGGDEVKNTTKSPTVNKSKAAFEEHCKKFSPTPKEEEVDEDIKTEIENHTGDEMYDVDEDSMPFDLDEPNDIEPAPITLSKDRLDAIRVAYRAADASVKAQVKPYLSAYGGKLAAEMMETDVVAIEKILEI